MNTGSAGICKEHVHAYPIAEGTLTAAGEGDNTEVQQEATAIDLKDHEGEHALLLIYWKAALTDTKTLSFRVRTRTASTANGAASATAVTQQALADGLAVTATAGATVRGVHAVNLPAVVGSTYDLDRYVLVDVLPDLNASGTDTAEWTALLTFSKTTVEADAVGAGY